MSSAAEGAGGGEGQRSVPHGQGLTGQWKRRHILFISNYFEQAATRTRSRNSAERQTASIFTNTWQHLQPSHLHTHNDANQALRND